MRNNPCSCTMLPFVTPGVLLTYCVAFNELWYLLNWIQFIFFIFQHLQVTESHNDSTTTCSLRSYSRLNDVHNKLPGNKMEESFMDRSSASKIQRESTSVTSFWNLKRRSASDLCSSVWWRLFMFSACDGTHTPLTWRCSYFCKANIY